MTATILERFWSKVNRKSDSGCWEWTGCKTGWGYGHFYTKEKVVSAHRLAYELFIGPIPEGLTIDHLCRNRWCVNPAHLEPVTNKTNILRGISPSANNAKKTHCLHGHSFDVENIYYYPDGSRRCRTCREISEQKRAASGSRRGIPYE